MFIKSAYACELPLDPATAVLGWSASLQHLNHAFQVPMMIAKKKIHSVHLEEKVKATFKIWLSELHLHLSDAYPKRLTFRLYIFLSVCVFPGN